MMENEGKKSKDYRCLVLLVIVAIFIWSFKDYYVYTQTKDILAEKDKKIAELNAAVANTYCRELQAGFALAEKEYNAFKAQEPSEAKARAIHEEQAREKFSRMREQGEMLLKCIGRIGP